MPTAVLRFACPPAGRWRGRARPDRAVSEKRSARMVSSVSAMLKRITHTFMYVLDQDKALDFYVGKLGMVVNTDADLGNMRWLTVAFPDDPELELALMVPGPPVHHDAPVEQRRERHHAATGEKARELIAKGGGNGVIFQTDDCRGTYERLKAEGVEFTQEPIERFYGTDCALRDPFGNPLRIPQPPDGPVVVPSKEELERPGMG